MKTQKLLVYNQLLQNIQKNTSNRQNKDTSIIDVIEKSIIKTPVKLRDINKILKKNSMGASFWL